MFVADQAVHVMSLHGSWIPGTVAGIHADSGMYLIELEGGQIIRQRPGQLKAAQNG